MRYASPGGTAIFQFPLYRGRAKQAGKAGELVTRLTKKAAGGSSIVESAIAVTAGEQAGSPGDYYAKFTVPAGESVGACFFLAVSWAVTGWDAEEQFEVVASDESATGAQLRGVPY